MPYLPTDEEYLSYIYNLYKHNGLLNLYEKLWNDYLNKSAPYPYTIPQGTLPLFPDYPDYSVQDATQDIEEGLQPEKFFQGRHITAFKNAALGILQPFRDQLRSVPVGMLPTLELNGRAIKTPRSGKIILLDGGVFWSLNMLIRSFLSFATWYNPAPFHHCRDHPQAEFAKSILYLAAFCASGDHLYLQKAALIYNCPSLPPLGEKSDLEARMYAMITLAVLLHEYGHIALGHIPSNKTEQLRLYATTTSVPVYTIAQVQEFEADEFAFQWMTKIFPPIDFAFWYGLLLNFFDLCEVTGEVTFHQARLSRKSHPPSHARWEKIKELARVSEFPDEPALKLDIGFDYLKARLRP
jgi:hypothetical protein